MAREDNTNGDERTARVAPLGVEPPDPPSAPEVDRRLRIRRGQLAGMVVIAALPLLALAGLFGISTRQAEGYGERVGVAVEYPYLHRYKVRHHLDIALTNLGSDTLNRVEIGLSTGYVRGFSDVAFTPGPDRIDDTDHVFVVEDLAAGETRMITAEMQAQAYGRIEGRVTWAIAGEGGVVVEDGALDFATLTLP